MNFIPCDGTDGRVPFVLPPRCPASAIQPAEMVGNGRRLFGEDASDKLVPCNDSAQLAEASCNVLETTKDGIKKKRHAETFKPDRVNQMWKDYVHDIICLSR